MKGAGEPAVDKSTAESSSTGNDGALDKVPSQPPQETSKSSRRSNTKESSGTSGRSKKGSSGQDKEMMDFRHLMVKGLELKKYKGSAPSEKCVIYMDVTCRTFFCAKQKNASNAKAYRVEDIVEANANGSNEKIICMVHNDGQLDLEVSSPKVNDCSPFCIIDISPSFNIKHDHRVCAYETFTRFPKKRCETTLCAC